MIKTFENRYRRCPRPGKNLLRLLLPVGFASFSLHNPTFCSIAGSGHERGQKEDFFSDEKSLQ